MTIEEVAEQICDKYCKYPYEWDEETEGVQLCESEICANCPLNRYVEENEKGENT